MFMPHFRGMPRKLKVFRTAIGFDDAYVAAPSRKAALAAWGADADLFSRGIAEEISDETLMKAPLAKPGVVVRLSRGDLAQHLKAMPKPVRRKAPKAAPPKRRPAKSKPPPTRDKLDEAERALAALTGQQRAEVAKIERELEALQARHAKARAVLERKRNTARTAFRAALERWTDGDSDG